MKKNIKNITNSSVTLYVTIGVLILMAIVTSLLLYGKSINDNVKKGQLSSEQIANIMEDKKDNKSQSASSSLGKTVEEGKNEIQSNTTNDKANEENKTSKSTEDKNEKSSNLKTNNTNSNNEKSSNAKSDNKKSNNSKSNNSSSNNANSNNAKNNNAKTNNTKSNNTKSNNTNSAQIKQTASTDKNVSIKLQKPVEGNIMREFAKDNLVFSETLKEWITHNGIDIQAEKTTVVQAAADGVIKTIKNDPRYGLTIVIEHENGLQTVYANLLSSEFVKEGEKVIQGQSIGTVGNTAVFESCDEPHLHFEVLKDSVQVDPSLYLK